MGFLDWLGAAAAAVGVLAAGLGAAAFIRRKYGTTIGSRRTLARKLDQLALGTTKEFNATLFGAPRYRSVSSGGTKLTYDCGHALVALVFDDAEGLAAFGMTVIDSKFAYAIDRLILCGNGAELGRSTFTQLRMPRDGAEFSVSKRDAWYAEDHMTAESDGESMSYTVAAVPFGARAEGAVASGGLFLDCTVRHWSTRDLMADNDKEANAIAWARRSFVMNTLLVPAGAKTEPLPEPGSRRKWR